MGKSIGKNIRKNVSSKYSQKHLDHAKQSATDTLKTASKRTIQKTSEATGDLIDNKIADKITKTSKTVQQNNSETITKENARGTYNTNSQNKFKASMLRSNLCDYGDAYIAVKVTMTVPNTGTAVENRTKIMQHSLIT